MARQILVTGGGGFLGSHIVKRLLEKGHVVRSFQRSAVPELEALGAHVIRGDISDEAAVQNAVSGCDAVIHTAALAGIWGPFDTYYRINVTGTETVVAAAQQAGVGYLVHTSTPSVVYNGQPIEGGDESLPYGEAIPCAYAATKVLAEKAALMADVAGQMRTCALRPHLIWGVGDPHLVPRILAKARSGRLRIVGEGTNRVDLTHVTHAAEAHLNALDALIDGRAGGEAFFISDGAPVNLWQWVNELLTALGEPPITKHLSAAMAYRLGGICERVWRLGNLASEPPMTRFVATELSKSHWFRLAKARNTLQFHPKETTDVAFKSLIDSLRA